MAAQEIIEIASLAAAGGLLINNGVGGSSGKILIPLVLGGGYYLYRSSKTGSSGNQQRQTIFDPVPAASVPVVDTLQNYGQSIAYQSQRASDIETKLGEQKSVSENYGQTIAQEYKRIEALEDRVNNQGNQLRFINDNLEAVRSQGSNPNVGASIGNLSSSIQSVRSDVDSLRGRINDLGRLVMSNTPQVHQAREVQRSIDDASRSLPSAITTGGLVGVPSDAFGTSGSGAFPTSRSGARASIM